MAVDEKAADAENEIAATPQNKRSKRLAGLSPVNE
jgi:hypothetical protein